MFNLLILYIKYINGPDVKILSTFIPLLNIIEAIPMLSVNSTIINKYLSY